MRMGLHRIGNTADDAFRAYVDSVRPPWVKMLDDWPPELIFYCHSRGTKVVGRLYFPEGEQRLDRADDRIARVVATATANPGVDAWELLNECHQSDADAGEYAAVSLRFAQRMNAIGRIAVIGSFSVGQPEFSYWTGFLPALRAAAASNGQILVGIHEYGSDELFHGVDGGAHPSGWWLLRYRRHRQAWDVLGLGEIGILISESGKDNILPDGRGGFRNRPGNYAVEMANYCRELGADPYVRGIVDFGYATVDPRWESFDLSLEPIVMLQMMNLMSLLPIGPAAPETPKEAKMPPINTTIRGTHYSNRLGYRPRYVVVHSAAGGPGLTARSLAQYLAQNSVGASAHYAVDEDEIFRVVDEGLAAHHAGGSKLPDGTTGTYISGNTRVDAVNAVSIGIEMKQVAGQSTPVQVADTTVSLAADICRRHGIPVERVVGHREISGKGGHSDPVGVDMNYFRERVTAGLGTGRPTPPTGSVDPALLAEAKRRRLLSINPAAALHKEIVRRGMVPTSNEFDFPPDLVCQVAMAASGKQYLIVCHRGAWSTFTVTQI